MDVGFRAVGNRVARLWKRIKTALEVCSLPALSWYSCTRYGFASHFVMGGGSIERMRIIMAHESVTTTERYSHLSPSHCGPWRLAATVDLSASGGKVIQMPRRRQLAANWQREPPTQTGRAK
jgi:hypothetical protein